MKRKSHKQQTTLTPSGLIKVDTGIIELIDLMNFPGMRTTNSCQGDPAAHDDFLGHGYVQFTGPAVPRFLHKLLTALISTPTMTDIEIGRWADNSTWPDSYSIRWRPTDYKKTLALVKEARFTCIRNFN